MLGHMHFAFCIWYLLPASHYLHIARTQYLSAPVFVCDSESGGFTSMHFDITALSEKGRFKSEMLHDNRPASFSSSV